MIAVDYTMIKFSVEIVKFNEFKERITIKNDYLYFSYSTSKKKIMQLNNASMFYTDVKCTPGA